MHKTVLALLLFFCSFVRVSAQSWEVGGFLGSSGYMGDINPTRPYKFTDLAAGAQVKRNFDGYWSLRLNAVHGKMQGADRDSPDPAQRDRNLDFYSPLTEVSILTEFNFFKYQASVSKRYSPYLFAGVGGVMFNPKTLDQSGQERVLRTYRTEGQLPDEIYNPYAIAVPYGVGVKYNIKGNWNLIGEIGYRTVFSDYLDDVSGRYANPRGFDPESEQETIAIQLANRSISSPSADMEGIQRGDFRKRDTYMFAGISLTFTFVSSKCYSF
ncbi:MAG TPA: DUF6089 family protein [Sphingobacteriaceae bacterium]